MRLHGVAKETGVLLKVHFRSFWQHAKSPRLMSEAAEWHGRVHASLSRGLAFTTNDDAYAGMRGGIRVTGKV